MHKMQTLFLCLSHKDKQANVAECVTRLSICRLNTKTYRNILNLFNQTEEITTFVNLLA